MKFICEKCSCFSRMIFVCGVYKEIYCDCSRYNGKLPTSIMELSVTEEQMDGEFDKLDKQYWNTIKPLLKNGWRDCAMLAEYIVTGLNT